MRMTSNDLESVAETLVAGGKVMLAADEAVPTLTKRFDTLGIGIKSTEQSRRTHREMVFTSPDAAEFIIGAIMYDEIIRQKSSGGTRLAETLGKCTDEMEAAPESEDDAPHRLDWP